MLVRTCWLWCLLFTVSTTALLSTSSTHHTTTSTSKKTTVPTSSTRHTTTSNPKKTTVKTSSTHHTSSSSTRSSSATPTSTPSTFYLLATDTGQPNLDNTYFNTVLDPYPSVTFAADRVLHFDTKTRTGAANFTLTGTGYLIYNSDSGPLYASVSNGHPYTQTMEFSTFDNPEYENQYGLVTVSCAVADKVLTCQWGPLEVFYYEGSDVGDVVDIGLVGDGTPFTIRVVPI